MNVLWVVILGIVQGFTEFLPVSSSGHLVILQSLIPSFDQPGVLFDVILHLGTTVAVVYFFRKTIINAFKDNFWFFVVGTVPAGLVGFFFRSQLESMFANVKLVGLTLIITAILNYVTDKTASGKNKFTGKNALLIGTAQALAIVPGISRSGATIFAGVKSGIDKKKAAEFSFILSIPAILGASVLQLFYHGVNGITDPLNYFFGFIAAFISGFFAIGFVLKTLHQKRFKYFGYYCLIVGVLVLLFN